MRIRVSARGGTSSPNISQFVGNANNTFQDCTFFINDPVAEADVWFVIEDLNDNETPCWVPPERIFFLTAETSWEPGHYAPGTDASTFLDQFERIYSCHDIFRTNVISAPPFLPWMINANHGSSILARHKRSVDFLGEIRSLPKEKGLSVFCSDQSSTANHRMRLRFVQELKSYFGGSIDWFGNGINPLEEKWDGIAPYRYTLVLENQSMPNLFTEKIYDAFLGLAYPIYWGAPNLSEYFDEGSFRPINIRDLNGSKATISGLLDSDLAEASLSKLLQSRDTVLHDLNLFARMAKIAQEATLSDPAGLPRRLVELNPIARPSVSKLRGGARGVAGRSLRRLASLIEAPQN